jgi:hypothetical protein
VIERSILLMEDNELSSEEMELPRTDAVTGCLLAPNIAVPGIQWCLGTVAAACGYVAFVL